MRLEEDLVVRRSRPTMISAKYRAREERRRLLKISAGKLRRIEDPEASLCRSVLINNAVRRLQRENRDEKTRNYGLPIVGYLDDSSKENKTCGNNLIIDSDNLSKKRLGEGMRANETMNSKRQRHDDLDIQDDVFSDFYILSSTPRILSHTDDVQYQHQQQLQQNLHHTLENYHSNRYENHSRSTVTTTSSSSSSSSSSSNFLISDDTSSLQRESQPNITLMDARLEEMECDTERICDFSRFADSTKSLEERLVELQSLDEHFDLTKFERNNNQSCGRAFHDIQTFHSLVPGLET